MLEVFNKWTGQAGVVDLITRNQLEPDDEAEEELLLIA